MINALASVGVRWQPSATRLAAAHVSATAMPQAHDAQLSAGATVAARPRGYAFAIRPRGIPPV